MGCSCSSLQYRDVYEELCKKVGLPVEETRATTPPLASTAARSNTFAAISNDVEAETGALRKVTDPAMPYLLEPKSAETAQLVTHCQKAWNLPVVHPLNQYMAARTVTALNAILGNDKDKDTIERQDYRLWLLTLCEIFHVLAVLQEQKCLPKPVKKWMSKVEKGKKVNSPDWQCQDGNSVLLAEMWSIAITDAHLKPAVMAQLAKEFPGAVCGDAKQASGALRQAREYSATAGESASSANPLQKSTNTTAAAAPFFGFVEWAVLQQALALRGPEEDADNYKRHPHLNQEPTGEVDEVVEEDDPPGAAPSIEDKALAKSEVDNPTTSVHGKSLPPTEDELPDEEEEELAPQRGCYDPADLAAWAIKLRRLDELERLLEATTSTAARNALVAEKEKIERELHELFDTVSREAFVLDQGMAAAGVFDTFNLQDVFGEPTEHNKLSGYAFCEAVSARGIIAADDQFRKYFGLYIHLYNMYNEARRVQGTDAAEISLLSRGETDATLRTLPDDEQKIIVDMMDPFWDVNGDDAFRPVFDELAGPEKNGAIDFGDLCQLVAHLVGGNVAAGLRDLRVLKRMLGVDRAGKEGREVGAAFVTTCCAATPACDASGNPATEEAFQTTVTDKARLKLFAPAPGSVTGMAAAFNTAAMAPCMLPRKAEASGAAAAGSSSTSTPPPPPMPTVMEWVTFMTNLALTKDAAREGDRLVLGSFFAHSVYNGAVVLRCVGDTRPDDAATRSIAGGAGGANLTSVSAAKQSLSLDTHMNRSWFDEATKQIAAVLECDLRTLLDGAGAILAARRRLVGNAAGGVEHNRPTPAKPTVPDMPGEPEEVVVGNRAFRELAAVDHEAGLHGTSVVLEDLVYVCLFNAAKHFFEDEPLLRAIFESPFLFNGSGVINALLNAFPMDDEQRQYRDFFSFSRGKRVVSFRRDATSLELDSPSSRFISAMYTHYADQLGPIVESEEVFARWCRDGVQLIKGDAGDFTARDYAALLEFLVGKFVAYATHRESKDAGSCKTTASLADDAVRRKLVEELLIFSQGGSSGTLADKAAGDGDAASTAKRVFTELQLNEMESRNGDVSLERAADWYAGYRVAHRSERMSQMAQWLKIAGAIPYTSSLQHRRTRRDMARALHKENKQRVEADPQAEGHEDGYVADGYIPEDLLVAGCLKLLPREGIALMPSFVDAEGWLRSCIRSTNEIVGRSDLGERELHECDLRFFFDFVHRDMTAFCTFQESKKEIDAVAALLQEGVLHPSWCDDQRATLQQALDRCLCVELRAPPACVEALTNDGCLSRFSGEGGFDSEGLSHHIARTIVAHDHDLFGRAQREFREELEAKVLEIYEHEQLLGKHPQDNCRFHHNSNDEPTATYWERLRHLLPHGSSLRQRALRQRLWDRIDIRGKGYVTLADLNRGLHDVLRLNDFRDDLAPVLFRAFFATTEMSAAQSDVVYITASNERFLTMREFRIFLYYFYSYMELYFMFDVLTCSGFLDEHQRIMECALDPSLGQHKGLGMGGDREAAIAPGSPLPGSNRPAAAIYAAADSPYAIMYESSGARKQVTLPQFETARRLLRRWGVRVEQTDAVFHDINRRAREMGEMFFTGFAIWASEKGLHPEGYGHGFTEDADEIAELEARLVAADQRARFAICAS